MNIIEKLAVSIPLAASFFRPPLPAFTTKSTCGYALVVRLFVQCPHVTHRGEGFCFYRAIFKLSPRLTIAKDLAATQRTTASHCVGIHDEGQNRIGTDGEDVVFLHCAHLLHHFRRSPIGIKIHIHFINRLTTDERVMLGNTSIQEQKHKTYCNQTLHCFSVIITSIAPTPNLAMLVMRFSVFL